MTWEYTFNNGTYAGHYNKLDTDRAWGSYIYPSDKDFNFMLQVPHPKADTNTEYIGVRMLVDMPKAFHMMAGAHRKSGGAGGNQGLADVPWNPGSMFNQVCAMLQPLPALQIHGYANSTQPDYEIVIATGSAPTSQLALDTYQALHDAGFNIARYWEGESDVLGASGNEQSKLARDNGSPFVHLEMNYDLRTNPSRIDTLISAISPVWNNI